MPLVTMSTLFVVLGILVVGVALVDVAWTTVAAGSGGGPVTSRVAAAVWGVARKVHQRRPSHTFLSFAGVLVVFTVLATWIALILAGWAMIFSASDGAVRAAQSGIPADAAGRLYFVGYTVFTLGNGDYVPGDGWWQVATVAAVGSGLILVTLSITYLVPVASAVAQRRQLASYISSLGRTPHEILSTGWDGSTLTGLSQHLLALGSMVQTAEQQHLAYPVLHYFHSREPSSAAAPNIVNLGLALDLLTHGLVADARPVPGVLEPMRRTLDSFLATLQGAHFAPAAPLAQPSLDPLRELGVPTVPEAEYLGTEVVTRQRRALLAGLLADDGWSREHCSAAGA